MPMLTHTHAHAHLTPQRFVAPDRSVRRPAVCALAAATVRLRAAGAFFTFARAFTGAFAFAALVAAAVLGFGLVDDPPRFVDDAPCFVDDAPCFVAADPPADIARRRVIAGDARGSPAVTPAPEGASQASKTRLKIGKVRSG